MVSPALEVSLVLEESGRPSILLGRLLFLQVSDHSSSLLLDLHDPRLCAHCALSPTSPPSRAPSPSSSSQSPPSQRAFSHTPLSPAPSLQLLEPLSPRAPAKQSRLSSSAPPPLSPAAISSCDPPASPPSFSQAELSSPLPPKLDAPALSSHTRSYAPSAGWSSTCPCPPSSWPDDPD